MSDDKVVPLHGGVVLPHEPTEGLRHSVEQLAEDVGALEVSAYILIGLKADGTRWFRWHISGDKVYAMIGAMTVTIDDVIKGSTE